VPDRRRDHCGDNLLCAEFSDFSIAFCELLSVSESLSSLSELEELSVLRVGESFRGISSKLGFQSCRTDTHVPNQGLASPTIKSDGRFSGKFAPEFGFIIPQQIAAAREQPT